MPIPDFQSLTLPLLELAGNGQLYRYSDAVSTLAERFSLSNQDLEQMLPSKRAPVFSNRVGWAKTHLTKAHLLESSSRGMFKITERGLAVLETPPVRIDIAYLMRFEEFAAFRRKSSNKRTAEVPIQDDDSDARTPDELIEYAHLELQKSLAQDLLQQVRACTPHFFEKLVIDVLVAMGYGGSFTDAAQVVGKSGDGGIDGIIKEDRLGLDVIYVQAKRWDEKISISRPEIQKFVGALHGHHASKGVFITTGRFAETARGYVQGLTAKVILIDGEQLARYMVDYNVGVTLRASYEVKKLDLDYFIEEY